MRTRTLLVVAVCALLLVSTFECKKQNKDSKNKKSKEGKSYKEKKADVKPEKQKEQKMIELALAASLSRATVLQWILLGRGARSPPNFRLGPCDSVSDLGTSTKLGSPETFAHFRDSCHSERNLDSPLRDTVRVFILLSYGPGL
ncbi:unnamed protein product [Heligmosomoides polygyrus]|uniref:Secreted protein n=1 Tax=Heligmosomoides polygyrus TaxID=6339 RepID=A0A183GLC9_HELPZ|nr:unnamed protein product [Heligmosomoides polygyrus]